MHNRQISDVEKQQVLNQQKDSQGIVRCFISGEPINLEEDEYDFDHLEPYAFNGETSVANIRVIKREYHRRKGTGSLHDARENFRLQNLYNQKRNNIKLQDIFELKGIVRKPFVAQLQGEELVVQEGQRTIKLPTYLDALLGVRYCYGRLPIEYLENDDQEGLQPRVIDFDRLKNLRTHLREKPQLAPSIARLVGNRLKLFDGQHKLAAQALNDGQEVDLKIYNSPQDPLQERRLFDALMVTNLEAHSKLKQVPFYTSTLLDRLSVIYRELLDDFLTSKPSEQHSEKGFFTYLTAEKKKTSNEAKGMLRAAIKTAVLSDSPLENYVAKASRDPSFPISQDVMDKVIYPALIYLEPSTARFGSDDDFRAKEAANFRKVAQILIETTETANWVATKGKGESLSDAERKARRIWHKASVLTWAPYLFSIIGFACRLYTNEQREQKLYRQDLDATEVEVIRACCNRLFKHPFWDDPSPEIDSQLVSAVKQNVLFNAKGLTESYVLTGQSG